MNLKYFILLITLGNINCYNPKRHTQTSSTSNIKHLKSKTSDPVIPARYKVTSKTNYDDPAITQGFPSDYFPEVEYPESVIYSSKPFYLNTSPFPQDVISSFDSFVAQGNKKAKTTTDYSWINNENEKSIKMISALSQKVAESEETIIRGNEINSNDKSTNETLHKDITTLDFEDDIAYYKTPFSDNDMKLFTNWSSIEQSDCEDIDYVVEFINDLDEFMKNLTDLEELEPNEGNNITVHAFESEDSDEIKLLYSGMTPKNNESIYELNRNSFLTESDEISNPLFEETDTDDALISLTSLLNLLVTNTSSVEDMESDFSSIGTIANETKL